MKKNKKIEREIHVYLTGRLGNQLFQYSFAKMLQKKYGGKIILNVYELEHRSEKMKHVPGKFSYDMENFLLNDEIELEDKKPVWFAFLGNFFNKICRKLFPHLFFKILAKKGYLVWMSNEYVRIPEMKQNKIFVCGWWQNLLYYENVEAELQKMIVPKSTPNQKNKYIYENINHNSVCVSIRGGNYLVPKIKKYLYVCDKNYFYDSIELIKNKISKPKFVVFSDDIEWVKSVIKLEERFPNDTFIYESGNDTVEEKIRMMTLFRNFIISNSSFSWWAQYLAPFNEKIVIAPNAWYVNGKKNGLYMKDWILVNVLDKKEV